MQRFIHGLEQKYDLKQEEPKSQIKQSDFILNASCSDLKARIERIFRLLNQSAGIVNETMYHDILSTFNLEVMRSGKGAVVLVTDNDGKIIWNPPRMSDIKERIKIPETYNGPDKGIKKQAKEQVTMGFKGCLKNIGFVMCRMQPQS